jgi:hypothetical protein
MTKHHHGLVALCLLSLAWTQTDDQEGFGGQPERFGGEVETEELGFDPVGETAGSEARPGEAHTVESGDTLWDLSTQFLNNPWYWPKVWSYNPQLTNPHWIYPGNEVRFYPGDENLPTAVDTSEDFDDLAIPGVLSDEDLLRTTGDIVTAASAPDSIWTAYAGFIDRTSQRFSGQIVGSFADSYQLDDYDILYVDMRGEALPGERVAIYRRQREVDHPVTGEFMGYAVEIIGQGEVRDSTPSITSVIVSKSYRPVERGDYVGPLPANWGARVGVAPNQVETTGYIVETTSDILVAIGEHHYVYIDRGRADGVQIGNRFTVLQRGDIYTDMQEGFPYEDVGMLLVVDVQENGSTAVVVDSVRSLSVGDRIVMTAD